jgi:pectate lyase
MLPIMRTSVLLFVALVAAAPVRATTAAFPGAQGWAALTPGGRGGAIVKVTTLAANGPGSLRAALEANGPRTIVFEVGGQIDLDRTRIAVTEPFVTVAGQTAPPPGITLLRGGIVIATHDVVVRHVRIRPGNAGVAKYAGFDIDALTTQAGAWNVIVDHCSFTWATDENLSASGARFQGADPDAWRASMSHAITFSNNLIAEGLAHSAHSKGEHSKGTLIHDNASDILLVGNLYAHNHERSALWKGGARGMMVNNLIYDPGTRAVHYNLIAEEWIEWPHELGRIALVGNVLRAGPSTRTPIALFMLGGSGDVELYLEDNIAVDAIGQPLPQVGRYTTGRARVLEMRAPALPHGVEPLAAIDVQDAVVKNAGATPWNRDLIDRRIVANVIEGRGAIIDGEGEVGGYPKYAPSSRPFVESDWDMATMEPVKPFPQAEPPR